MKVIATNKKAKYNYEILESIEAGISLLGTEVKSVREGGISLKESHAEIKEGEVFIVNCHINPYEAASRFNHDPRRERKLLLHRREIKRLIGKIQEKGFTLIPTKVFFNDKGRVQVEVSLVKGKRTYEKREAIRERDHKRELRAELKKARR